jgi:hypothetical protein
MHSSGVSRERAVSETLTEAFFMWPEREPDRDTFSSTTVVLPVMSDKVRAVSMVFGA